MKKDVERKTGTIDILMVSLAIFSILLVIVDSTIATLNDLTFCVSPNTIGFFVGGGN